MSISCAIYFTLPPVSITQIGWRILAEHNKVIFGDFVGYIYPVEYYKTGVAYYEKI
jgi:hypothetical protein